MHAFIRSTVKNYFMGSNSAYGGKVPWLGYRLAAGRACLGRVAIGLALKDSLSNIASGMLIIASKNYKSGDYIELEGAAGSIDSRGPHIYYRQFNGQQADNNS